jgi:hypothetical protein
MTHARAECYTVGKLGVWSSRGGTNHTTFLSRLHRPPIRWMTYLSFLPLGARRYGRPSSTPQCHISSTQYSTHVHVLPGEMGRTTRGWIPTVLQIDMADDA